MSPRTLLLLAALAAGAPVRAQEGEEPRAEPVSFYRDVRPILQASCQGCHQPAKAEGELILTTHAGLLVEREAEPAVIPGEPGQSLLIDVVTPVGDKRPEMPDEGEPLTPDQVALIARWIAEGALDDTPDAVRSGADRPTVYARPPIVTALDFSPDGELLAVSGRGEVLLHRADGSGLVARLAGLSERIESVAFSPDGKRLAVAGGAPARLGELQIWDVAKRELELSRPVTFDTIHGVSWSGDGTRVAFGCNDDTVRALDAATGEQVLYQGAHDDWVLDTAFSTDDSHLVSVGRDRSMKLIKVETQQFIDNITSITPGELKGGLMSVARHPARDELLVGGADGTPRIYRMYREKKRVIGDDYNLIQAFEPLPGRVFSVVWSPDGASIAAGSSSHGTGAVRLYRVEGAELVWSRDLPAGVYAIAFHPDGQVVAAAGFAGVVSLLDAGDGHTVREFVPVPVQEPQAPGAVEAAARRTGEASVGGGS